MSIASGLILMYLCAMGKSLATVILLLFRGVDNCEMSGFRVFNGT